MEEQGGAWEMKPCSGRSEPMRPRGHHLPFRRSNRMPWLLFALLCLGMLSLGACQEAAPAVVSDPSTTAYDLGAPAPTDGEAGKTEADRLARMQQRLRAYAPMLLTLGVLLIVGVVGHTVYKHYRENYGRPPPLPPVDPHAIINEEAAGIGVSGRAVQDLSGWGVMGHG